MGNDDAVVDAELEKRIAAGTVLGDEFLMGIGHLAVLMTSVLFVGNPVSDLQGASAGFDHLFASRYVASALPEPASISAMIGILFTHLNAANPAQSVDLLR